MTNSDDRYVLVNATLVNIRPRAILIEADTGQQAWIPRSCLHGGSDGEVANADPGDTLLLKVREWKVKQEDLPYADSP